MSRVFVGDSNVDHFWADALSDRKEMKSSVSFIRLTKLEQVDATLASLSTGHVVMSFLSNLVVDHVESIGPLSQENLNRSVSTILSRVLDENIFPLCFRLKDFKVSVLSILRSFLSQWYF